MAATSAFELPLRFMRDVLGSHIGEQRVLTNNLFFLNNDTASIPWIDELHKWTSTGYLQYGLVGLSVVAIIRSKTIAYFRPSPENEDLAKFRKISIPHEVAAQAARGAATAFFILSAFRDEANVPSAVAATYAFTLGLSRLLPYIRWQQTALHHSNFVTAMLMVVNYLATWLPCVQFKVSCTLKTSTGYGLFFLVLSSIASFIAPRSWVPPRKLLESPVYSRISDFIKPAPEEVCSWFNYYCSYDFLTPLMIKGWSGNLKKESIPDVPWYDDPEILYEKVKVSRAWGKTTAWTVAHFVRVELFLMSLWTVINNLADLVAPFGLYHLLRYIDSPEDAIIRPWTWIAIMFFGPLVRSVAFQQYVFTSTRLIVRIKSGITQELYRLALDSMEMEVEETEPDGTKKTVTSTGRLATLIASDIEALYRARDSVMVLIGLPTGALGSMIGLYLIMGWGAIVGVGILIVSPPIIVMLMQRMLKYQMAVRKAQDNRMSLVSEFLTLIKAVKYFAWESYAEERIQDARQPEQGALWTIACIDAVIDQVSNFARFLSLFSMFFVLTVVEGRQLTASVAFTTITLTSNLRHIMNMIGFISKNLTSASIAVRRLDAHFQNSRPVEKYPVGPPRIVDGTFRRNPNATFALEKISIDFVENGLNVIQGHSGSGKSTLLLALLGETIKENGYVTTPGNAGYSSQSSWLQNATIRDNILFTNEMEQVRYDKVIAACCLEQDFAELKNGDNTEIGENGTSLSGGQRARVALARSLYSKTPVLLLDDIFSALDARTAASLWELCFCSDMLKGRTVILVTQIPWLAEQADLAVTLENGTVKSVEPHIDAVRRPISSSDLASETAGSQSGTEGNDETRTDAKKPTEPTAEADDAIDEELKSSKSTGRNLSWKYLTYYKGGSLNALCVVLTVVAMAMSTATRLWLVYWTNDQESAMSQLSFYLGIFAALTLLESTIQMISNVSFEFSSWFTARQIHKTLVNSVFNVSMNWYNKIPIGRVINRFSRDITSMDSSLPHQLQVTIYLAIDMLFQLGCISSIMPIFVLPAAITSAAGVLIGEVFTRTAVAVRRIESSSQSPVFSQFSDTLAGLAVVRAQPALATEFRIALSKKLRVWSASAELTYNCNRWVGVRIDLVTGFVSLGAGMIALWKSTTVSAALVGFSLTSAANLSESILYLVRFANDLEVELQSFDRVLEYSSLEPETANDETYPLEGEYTDNPMHVIPKAWPVGGDIEFRNVSVRYTEDGPDVLSEVNLKFRAGERVAIVGRTGSGKSTMVASLLRFTEIVKGEIIYNGIDITKVPRRKLRQSLTIIPQEAVLFTGTVRSNLDPTGTIPDEVLQKAVDACKNLASFKAGYSSSDEETTVAGDATPKSVHEVRLSLDTEVTAKGENFSHGQRQVISLIRAIVRDSQLMLLDEATASMDYETDKGIQEVLRKELAGSGRTLVTIAHRLRTIIDYDTVVVMGAGRVLESGSPLDLYKKKAEFYDMVQHSGEKEDLEGILE